MISEREYKQGRKRALAQAKLTGKFFCPNPNCDYAGEVRREPRGSQTLGCLLLVLGILPGIIYMIFASGYKYYCPKCYEHLGSELFR